MLHTYRPGLSRHLFFPFSVRVLCILHIYYFYTTLYTTATYNINGNAETCIRSTAHTKTYLASAQQYPDIAYVAGKVSLSRIPCHGFWHTVAPAHKAAAVQRRG